MGVPAQKDTADHLLITAHFYWLTGEDGEGSRGIHYIRQKPRELLNPVCHFKEDMRANKRFSIANRHTIQRL